MEWLDFPWEIHEFGIEKRTDWNFEENKTFENALAELDPTSQSFFEDIASKIPRKSIQQIKNHYEALIADVEMIECGEIPIPRCNYIQSNNLNRQKKNNLEYQLVEKKENFVGGSSCSSNVAAKPRQSRQKGVPWTEEEHQLFLMGLNRYGKGDWRSISRYYVMTKTPTQVASHAQKYFKRQTSTTPIDRRRPSIHDVKTVNLSTFTTSQVRQSDHRHGGSNVLHNYLSANYYSAHPQITNNHPLLQPSELQL